MTNAHDKNDQRVVPQRAYDPVIADAIAPETVQLMAKGLPKYARIVGRRDPGLKIADDVSPDVRAESVQIVDRPRVVFNRPGQEPGAPGRWSGAAKAY